MEDTEYVEVDPAFQKKVHRVWKGERRKRPHGKFPNWALLLILAALLALFVYMIVTI